MAEQTFTIFDGPDTGKQFVLGSAPIAVGRDAARDVHLHDERVSRLHLRLTPGEEPVLTDENSSNGTFVNGALVRSARLRPGDVIAIGNTKIIFGATAPQLAQIEEMRRVRRTAAKPPGEPTALLPEPAGPTPALQSVKVERLLADLSIAIRPECEKVGIRIHVQVSPSLERVQLDARKLLGAMARMMTEFLGLLRLRPDNVEKEALIALRGCPDSRSTGMMLEVICIGIEIPQNDVRQAAARGAFRALEEAVAAHAGELELLSARDEDVLVRIRLPLAGTAGAATVIRNPA